MPRRRRVDQLLHRGVDCSSGEDPVVAGPERRHPPGRGDRVTWMPSSTISVVPPAGTLMTPPLASTSSTAFCDASRTIPFWSQRVTRVWRVASVGSNWPAGRAPSQGEASARRRRPVDLAHDRPGARTARASRRSPRPSRRVLNRSTASRPGRVTVSSVRDASMASTVDAIDALSRDHLKVAVPSPPGSWTSTR